LFPLEEWKDRRGEEIAKKGKKARIGLYSTIPIIISRGSLDHTPFFAWRSCRDHRSDPEIAGSRPRSEIGIGGSGIGIHGSKIRIWRSGIEDQDQEIDQRSEISIESGDHDHRIKRSIRDQDPWIKDQDLEIGDLDRTRRSRSQDQEIDQRSGSMDQRSGS
jgi:hypothetical protein